MAVMLLLPCPHLLIDEHREIYAEVSNQLQHLRNEAFALLLYAEMNDKKTANDEKLDFWGV
jgi:hypothetical protein